MALGIGTFLGGIGKLLGKIPIQGRSERWKNELDNLKKERAQLLKGEWDVKKANRLNVVDARIEYLNQLLRNSSTAD